MPTEDIDPERRDEIANAMLETSDWLRNRGVALTGRESSDELANLMEAVERFEAAVESRGGDLMVDEPPPGGSAQPDDVHFLLPRRRPGEPVAEYCRRLDRRTGELRHHPPLE